MSTLDQMQAFVAVVEEGSFTAAAKQFNLSPTAICKKVAVLEKSLNTRLLIRTPRLITMTDVGEKYFVQCKKVLHEYKLSNLVVESKEQHLSGVLSIVCTRHIAMTLVYPSMAFFLEQYPHLVTNVTLKGQVNDINVAHFDIVVGYEISEVFNELCYRKLDDLIVYFPNIKPVPQKIKVYVDYLAEQY